MATGQSIAQSIRRQAGQVLKTGQRFDKFDQIRQRHFWSSHYFTPNANGYVNAGTYSLFTTPVGSNGQGFPSGFVITERESNWKSQNRVPDNQNFEAYELGCGYMSADFAQAAAFPGAEVPPASGLSNFFNSSVLSISYLTNSVPLGLLSDFAQAAGPFMGINLSQIPAVEGIAYNSVPINGFAAPALRRKFKIPILLQHGESFSFNIEVPRTTYVGAGGAGVPFLVRVDFFATESFVEKS
jgi:hypothetical protein